MRVTLSVIKADVGSIGGHLTPSTEVLETVAEHIHENGHKYLIDHRVHFTGDDVAILMTHERGADDAGIHGLAFEALMAGAKTAKAQGLYGAGQDLLKDAFSGNVRGMGPAVAEMTFDERPNEPFLFFAADKTDPGAFNLPLYLAFTDPMNTPGLILSPELGNGFEFVIMDVNNTERDRVIRLKAPAELYDIAALLRNPERYVVEAIYAADGSQAVAVATSRLHNIAGKYTGKDDPVMLVRVQKQFPATGEVVAPYHLAPYVAGAMRGSHNMPLMPVQLNSTISYFDGPPIVTCAAFCVHQGRLVGPTDVFDHPFWDTVRANCAAKAIDMRRQGFFGPAMLPMDELEYTGIVERLTALDKRFKLR
ncbi:fructose-1,6-bisphosphate aldolase/phosphatase [Pseudokordiimonas caeni]|uniref:fructose-1,6-bisphosphate aldolase/phosphatase n=1 Tax=Pseudokordiimonas caeni TaxID=2997908 RepID=UPI0028128618|nr:fructose-1,6-bisphosphate aldolase/phosphatase [Pseudokordiimonas caeni]